MTIQNGRNPAINTPAMIETMIQKTNIHACGSALLAASMWTRPFVHRQSSPPDQYRAKHFMHQATALTQPLGGMQGADGTPHQWANSRCDAARLRGQATAAIPLTRQSFQTILHDLTHVIASIRPAPQAVTPLRAFKVTAGTERLDRPASSMHFARHPLNRATDLAA